jgi:hypothetical protein
MLAAAGGLVADSSHPGPTASDAASSGFLRGRLPLCYGPGPDNNLTPTLAVSVIHNGETVIDVTLPATNAANSYHFSLPPGGYVVRAGKWSTRQVEVRTGAVTIADLPDPGCL